MTEQSPVTKYLLKCKRLGSLYEEVREVQTEIVKLQGGDDFIDEIEIYRLAYDNKVILENMLKAVKERLGAAKDNLIVYLGSQGVSSVKRDEKSYSHTQRVFPKVEDYDKLMDWVTTQDKPRSVYLDIKFKGKKLTEIINDARVNHPGQEADVLPPGLGYSAIDIITVRAAKPTNGGNSAMDRLLEIANGGT